MIRPLPCRCALLLAATSALAACTTLNGTASYVTHVETPADATVLAAGIADFLAAKLPAASSTLVLDPTPADQAGNAVTPALVSTLRTRGFAIADDKQGLVPGAHHIQYLVTPLDNGDLVRVSIDAGTEASRLFVRNTAGSLQAGGPFAVREVAETGQ